MDSLPPRGLIVHLISPLTEDGRVDRASLLKVMSHSRDEAAGYLVGSLSLGEAAGLSMEQRLELFETALSGSKGRSLFFEITALDEDQTFRLLKEAENLLAKQGPVNDVFYYLTPLVYHSNRDLPRHFEQLGGLTRRGFILANHPELATVYRSPLRHKNVRTAVLKKMGSNLQLVGVAYSGDLDRALGYQRALKLRPAFRFYDSSEENFLSRPSSAGPISRGASVMPAAWAEVVKSSLNIYDARRLYPEYLNRIWLSGQVVRTLAQISRSNPPAFIKAALGRLGLISGRGLAPGTPWLSVDETNRLYDFLKQQGLS